MRHSFRSSTCNDDILRLSTSTTHLLNLDNRTLTAVVVGFSTWITVSTLSLKESTLSFRAEGALVSRIVVVGLLLCWTPGLLDASFFVLRDLNENFALGVRLAFADSRLALRTLSCCLNSRKINRWALHKIGYPNEPPYTGAHRKTGRNQGLV